MLCAIIPATGLFRQLTDNSCISWRIVGACYMIGGIIAGYQEDQEATCGDSKRTVTKWLMRCSDGLVASLYCIFDSDLDAAVMLGTRLPLEIFYPLCENRTM